MILNVVSQSLSKVSEFFCIKYMQICTFVNGNNLIGVLHLKTRSTECKQICNITKHLSHCVTKEAQDMLQNETPHLGV